jgi:hypothetical protein
VKYVAFNNPTEFIVRRNVGSIGGGLKKLGIVNFVDNREPGNEGGLK